MSTAKKLTDYFLDRLRSEQPSIVVIHKFKSGELGSIVETMNSYPREQVLAYEIREDGSSWFQSTERISDLILS